MWRGDLTSIGSTPKNILGVTFNQLQAEIVSLNLTTLDVTIKFTLFTTAQEQNPGFSTTVLFPGSVNHAFSFSANALLAAAKTALNL